MANILEFLVPKVSAQAADALSQPTFGSIDSGGGSTTNANILLSSNKTAVKVGEKFKVKVNVKTNDVAISEYRLVIDFDPNKFSVVDANLNVAGTQIYFLDNVFTIEDAATDNTVASVGRIRLNAKAPDSTPLSVNKDVAEIEFQAQSLGSTSVNVVQGVTGSQVVRQAGVGLSFTSNEITINVTTETVTGNDEETNGGNTNTGNTGNNGNVDVPTTIPNTAIGDDISVLLSLGIGFLLLLLGLSLKRNKDKEKRKVKI